jgi:DNA-binding transcriptional ArsR family regulator
VSLRRVSLFVRHRTGGRRFGRGVDAVTAEFAAAICVTSGRAERLVSRTGLPRRMARMFPESGADADDEPRESAPRVIGLDSDEADATLSALSSGTSRRILTALHERSDTPASVADRVDTSLQNAQYHLSKLADAGLVEVVDTVYSEKGREMKVYAPADRPLVVFAGGDEESAGLESALTRLLGAVGVLALASLLVQFALRGVPFVAQSGGADGGAGAEAAQADAQTTAVETAGAVETAVGLPPGLLFFLGGLTVLVGILAVRYVRTRRAAGD